MVKILNFSIESGETWFTEESVIKNDYIMVSLVKENITITYSFSNGIIEKEKNYPKLYSLLDLAKDKILKNNILSDEEIFYLKVSC